MESGNTAAIESYLSDPVMVILAATECCGPLTPAGAIDNLDYVAGATGWDFALPESLIDDYRDGDYAAQFPPEVIVGKAASGEVIAFGIEGSAITNVFMSISEEFLLW